MDFPPHQSTVAARKLMVDYSVLIPVRNGAADVARQIPHLSTALERLGKRYELLVIDDGSTAEQKAALERLTHEVPQLRLLRFSVPQGYSRSLAAGIAAAYGEHVLTLPLEQSTICEQIPYLLERLSRADLVCGRRTAGAGQRAWRRVRQFPWRWLLGPLAQDPDARCWVARTEAVAGLHLPRGAHRYLPQLVSLRGYRVTEVAISHTTSQPAGELPRERSHALDLWAAWWLARRTTASAPHEYVMEESSPAERHLRIDRAQSLDGPRQSAPLRRTA